LKKEGEDITLVNPYWTRNTDEKQDVFYQVVREAPLEVVQYVREDIRKYIEEEKGGLAAKKRKDEEEEKNRVGRIESRGLIVPRTEVKFIDPEGGKIVTTGKPEFTPECLNIANWDPGRGCITSLVGIKKESQIRVEGKFVEGVFVAPWRECDICYAENKHKSFLKTQYRHSMEQLEVELRGGACLTTGSDKPYGKLVKFLRFGKRTEAASKFTRTRFLQVLEVCARTGTQGIIPTKFLEYDKEVDGLLKRTNSVVLFDYGWDEYEKGACSFGCTNKWRLERAVEYGAAGRNSVIYMHVKDATKEPTERDLNLLKKIEKYRKYLTGCQVLPVRYKSKQLAMDMARVDWDLVSKPHTLLEHLDDSIYSWEVNAGELIPRRIHLFG